MRGWSKTILCLGIGLLAAGCPKGKPDYQEGRKAENLQDYDAAYDFFQKALKSQPENAEYQIKFNQARFEAAAFHVKEGVKLRERGDLQGAAGQFQRAVAIDPSSPIAEQELRKTADMIGEREHANEVAADAVAGASESEQPVLASEPPELKPLLKGPINLTMTNDAKIVFDTIGKLAGLTVVYDPDFPARRIPISLTNVTMKQALDIAAMESKAFWKPVTENIIFVVPDQPQKRRDYEEQVVKTFYLSNTVQAQDLTEIVTGLRQLLDLKRIQQLNAQNAIIIRASPDQLAIAEKMIDDIDKAKPEVVIQVQVLEARLDKMRNLGILPGQSASVGVVPPGTTTTTTGTTATTTSTTTNILTLQNLTHLNGSNYSVTLPSFTANALLNDSTTRIIQNPEVRSVDGQPAKLRIGDRVPVATGSFQAGVGVGSTAGSGFVNPLVNTQFQYIDVGVNVDITPRVHPNHEVSLKVSVEVSSVTGQANIGGIQQPIISQRKLDHEIRLKEGEASILGGLVEKTDTKSNNGWPGLGNIPLLRYLFAEDTKSYEDDEILIILTPRIVRMPEWTKANLRALYSGSESNVQVRRESDVRAPAQEAPQVPTRPGTPPMSGTPGPANAAPGGQSAQMHFEPRTRSLKVGEEATIGVVVDNVNDLFSIPFLLQYDPKVISVEEVQHAAFLQSGDQEIAIVTNINKVQGQAIISATRRPNTAGVSGTGTIMGIVVKALAPGTSSLSIVQVNAKDSQQKPIPLVTSEATLQVQP